MTQLDDLFDLIDLEQAVEAGFVRTQTHPSLPFTIYNYSEKATFGRVWTPVTRQCRGLIVHTPTGEILARPFPKFMNYTEPGASEVSLDDPVTVTDKMDGSLGVLYPTGDGGWAIATRGSFTSEQAQHATAIWQERYADRFTPAPGMTYLFEIVYPGNRIVVDYGALDDLVLLGSVEIATGISFDPGETEAHGNWPGPTTQTFYYSTFRDALEAPPRPGQEGLVVRRAFSESRIKLKQAEYVELHRILTNVTARSLWEYLAVNTCWEQAHPRTEEAPEAYLTRRLKMDPARIREIRAIGPDWMAIYLKGVPEEFREWVETTVESLAFNALRLAWGAYADYLRICPSGQRGHLRGEDRAARTQFVRDAQTIGEHWRILMAIADNEEIHTWAWGEVYPAVERPFRTVSEATA